MSRLDNVSVIIRSIGERTATLCRTLILEQVREENVSVVSSEAPFLAALAESYRIGIEGHFPWTVCVDADVLLSTDAIRRCINTAIEQPDNNFGLSGFLLDKFYASRKRRGFHVYRTDLLPKAHKLLSEVEGAVRPETEVKKRMADLGHLWGISHEIYGIHDYEQFYSDIFRKMTTRSVKSASDREYLLKRARLLKPHDADFLVAEWALRYGATLTPEQVELRAEQWKEISNALLTSHGIEEKKPLRPDEISPDYVGHILTTSGHAHNERIPAGNQTLNDTLRRALWRTGKRLKVVGSRLQRKALG